MKTCIRCHKDFAEDSARFCPYCGAVQERKTTKRKRGNGTGTAVKRGNQYEARIVVGWKIGTDGKHKAVYRSKWGFKTKQDALQYIPILRQQKPKTQNLNHYWELWSQSDMLQLSQSKQTAYRIASKKLSKLFFTNIEDISIQALKTHVEAVCPSYYTARDAKALLKILYGLADADGIGNPRLPSYIKLPKLNEKEGQAFSDEQLTKMWSAYEAGDLFIGYIILMIYTGMMPGELLDLKLSSIDLDNGQIVGAGKKTKVRKATPITVAEFVKPVLLALMTMSNGAKLVPMNRDRFYEQYHQHIVDAGVRDLPPYSCRHTTATALAVGEGVAPQIIRKVMRWSTTKMLSRYAHPDMQDAQNAVERLKKAEK